MSNTITRRKFIYGAAAGTAAGVLSARSWSQVPGANGDIRHAVIGFNGRGQNHIDGFRKISGVRLVALCDADTKVLDRANTQMQKAGNPVDIYTDVRRMLEDKDIDTISIATPNHWHALGAIWGIQAGKDVYVEKPVSHNVWEGRQLVEAARKYKKIVQTGTQSRSNPGLQEGIAYLHSGNLGKIKLARGLCYKPRKSIGKVSGPQPIPKNIDYDLWCGPAPMEPLMRKNLHYDWHWVWPTGNGDLGNQGIHQMDIARWVLKHDTLSPAVLSIGGRLGYEDDGTTPNTQLVFHDYPEMPLIFEVRGLPHSSQVDKMDNYRGSSIGVVVDCEDGYMVIPSYDTAIAYDKDGKEIKKFRASADHYDNFVKAVRSRRHEELNADIIEGHLSSALCHTGNISYRLGMERSQEEIREALQSHSNAQEAFGRFAEHLAANNVNLDMTKAKLGVYLAMNPKKERFIGNEAANQMLTRDYRKPYVVPEQV